MSKHSAPEHYSTIVLDLYLALGLTYDDWKRSTSIKLNADGRYEVKAVKTGKVKGAEGRVIPDE